MSTSAPVLNADPGANYRRQRAAIDAAVQRVLASGSYILGAEGDAFEREFAAYHGTGFAVGVANGTDALELALRAVGVRVGDAVATVANTVTATVAAIVAAGGRPVFVDVDGESLNMSVPALERMLQQQKVRAVVPVHLYGRPAELRRLQEVTRRAGAALVEDCAQAHGATWDGRKVGTWGDAAAYSFYPTKNLGALGDGGAVYTRRPEIAEQVKLLRQYGWRTRYVASGPGRNSRLDELQAAILRVKLAALDEDNRRRREIAAVYRTRLVHPNVRMLAPVEGEVFHQFVVRAPRRDALRDHLAKAGVHAAVLYPVPIHHQSAYAQPETVLVETERACAEVLSLPVHPELSDADVERIVAAVAAWKP